MFDEIQKKLSDSIDRGFMDVIYGNGCASTYSNACETSALDMNAMVKAIEMLEATKPAPPPIKILTNDFMLETIQTRFPKSKRKRIRKKCKKKYTKEVPMRDAYWDQVNGRLFCHPSVKDAIIRGLTETNKPIPHTGY